MSELAINGGNPIRDPKSNPWPRWPVWGEEDHESLRKVLDSGIWSYNGEEEQAFTDEWKEFVGTKYALCAANGTVTLQIALEALGIGFGDEVIVPGITWQATAAAVLDVNAVPILVDVEEDSWCIDVNSAERALSNKTKAIIPVHLYGCIADMDAIMDFAAKHKLYVIEDAAHQHGSSWEGKRVGSIGDIGSFSMQLSKVLTAGEGGAITTNNERVYVLLDALRNCGRRPVTASADKGSGQYGEEGDLIQSGNFRITEFQAGILRNGLKRLPEQNRLRDENACYLKSMLKDIPGIVPMKRDPRVTEQAYFNFAFRYHKDDFRGMNVGDFREAISAELGIKCEQCYQPLTDCTLYRPHTKRRYYISDEHWNSIDPSRFELPNCRKAFDEESVVFHHSVLLAGKADMEQIAEAIKKIRRKQ